MSEKREDLRVRRSRKLLQEALIELTVEQKGFSAITVHDITERAMVNRSTFYRHYLDKCDLVAQYMDEVYALITYGEKVVVPLGKTEGRVPSGLLNLLKHVQDFANFYEIMLGVDGDAGFAEHFRRNLENRFRILATTRGEPTETNVPPLELRLKFVSTAGVGTILWWLQNKQPCSVEQLTSWLSQLCFPIWSGTSGQANVMEA